MGFDERMDLGFGKTEAGKRITIESGDGSCAVRRDVCEGETGAKRAALRIVVEVAPLLGDGLFGGRGVLNARHHLAFAECNLREEDVFANLVRAGADIILMSSISWHGPIYAVQNVVPDQTQPDHGEE